MLEPIYLECFSNCDTIDLGILADVNGQYVLRTEFNGQYFDNEFDFLANDPIQFPAKFLNENYTYRMKILPPPLSAIDSKQEYRFTIKPKI
jgi:hypothetical protein